MTSFGQAGHFSIDNMEEFFCSSHITRVLGHFICKRNSGQRNVNGLTGHFSQVGRKFGKHTKWFVWDKNCTPHINHIDFNFAMFGLKKDMQSLENKNH